MKLRLIFYKAEGRFVDKLIRWWTNSIYSHCEILFPDGRIFSADAWYGSVRYSKSYNLDNWDMQEIDIDEAELKRLCEWCDWKNGSAYDWFGVIAFVLPFVHEDTKKWFCSELCASALKWVGKLPPDLKTYNLSPGDLCTLLEGNKDVKLNRS